MFVPLYTVRGRLPDRTWQETLFCSNPACHYSATGWEATIREERDTGARSSDQECCPDCGATGQETRTQ